MNDSKKHQTPYRVKHVRRQVVFDVQTLNDLSERAVQLCPYSNFCFLNGTAIENNRRGRVSCCKDCYCDEGCGERMDCCFDFLDVAKIVDNNDLKCIMPVDAGVIEELMVPHGYYMVDKCLTNLSFYCRT